MTTLTIISKEELKSKLDKKEDFQLINVLGPDYNELGSIPGSLRIPVDQLEKRLGELDKTKEAVVYCASYECHASRKAAEILTGHGFCAVAYEGGLKEWKEAGFPTEANKKDKGKSKGSCSC
jgi:ArsR family transcriptional regulator